MSFLRLKLLWWLFPAQSSAGRCANRWWRESACGPYTVTLKVHDTSQPDGYSREELLTMLETVRRHEALQGWTVPEP